MPRVSRRGNPFFWLNVKQAAEHIGTSSRLIQKWAAVGRLPGARKYRGDWLIPRAAATDFCSRPVGRPPVPAPVQPLDVTPHQFREALAAWAATYEDVMAIAQEFAPCRAAAVSDWYAVLTAERIKHLSRSDLPIGAADWRKRKTRETRAPRHLHIGNVGKGPAWLSLTQVRALKTVTRDARRNYLDWGIVILQTNN